LKSEEFIQNKGLGNEVGFYIFDYDPKDELVVRDYIEKVIKKELNYEGSGRRIIEYDLYNILIDIAKEFGVFEEFPKIEEREGKTGLLEAVASLANCDEFVKRMTVEQKYGDIIFITGVGKAYPFMRSHLIINNLHPVLDKVPVILFFPGKYDGQSLQLFGKFKDDNYYRAFRLID